MSKAPESGKTDAPIQLRTSTSIWSRTRNASRSTSRRMIEQAGKAASAWVEPREKGEVRDSVAEPMADMVKTFSKVTEYWLSDPARALEAQTRLFSGYLTVWGNAISRVSAGEETPRCDQARSRRQALPGSRMGQERLLRFPEAGLSRHLALGRRPGRARRRARRAHAPQGRLLRQADLQRDLAVQLHPDQPGAVSRDGGHPAARTWCAA